MKIYSPSGSAGDALNFLTEVLGRAGVEVNIDDYGVLTWAGENPIVLLCGHVDTVPGRLPVILRNGILSGRGVVDAKGPLAAMICAFLRLPEDVRNSVYLAVVSDEETPEGSGTEALLKRLPGSIRYGIVGEPSRGRGVTVSYHGRLSFWLKVRGKAMHASASIARSNAIEFCFQLYSSIKNRLLQSLGKIPICPTVVHGGDNFSSLPESCRLYVDLRVPPSFSLLEIKQVILDEADRFRDRDFKIDVVFNSFVEPFSVNPDSILVRTFLESIRKVMKVEPILINKLGTSDFNLIGRKLGIPVVAYGPGNPRLSHTNIERLLVSEYLSSIDVLERVVKSLVRCVE